MKYQFLIETYETEILKVVGVWSMFEDEDMPFRPHSTDPRGRSVHEHMIHQSVSEDFWFRAMLGIEVTNDPFPAEETRIGFTKCYAENAHKRLRALVGTLAAWWEEIVDFFEVKRSRAWVMTRRIAHTAHHRGQQTMLLRMLNRPLHSTYGPTADTGGLMQNNAPVIYAYADLETLLREEAAGRRKTPLPGPGTKSPTERPG